MKQVKFLGEDRVLEILSDGSIDTDYEWTYDEAVSNEIGEDDLIHANKFEVAAYLHGFRVKNAIVEADTEPPIWSVTLTRTGVGKWYTGVIESVREPSAGMVIREWMDVLHDIEILPKLEWISYHSDFLGKSDHEIVTQVRDLDHLYERLIAGGITDDFKAMLGIDHDLFILVDNNELSYAEIVQHAAWWRESLEEK